MRLALFLLAMLAVMAVGMKADDNLVQPVIEASPSTPSHMVDAELAGEEESSPMVSLLEAAIDEHVDNASAEDMEEMTSLLETTSSPQGNSLHLSGRILDSNTGRPLTVPGGNPKRIPNEIVKDGVKLSKAYVIGQKKPAPAVTPIHRGERVLTRRHARTYTKAPRYNTPAGRQAKVYHRTGVKGSAVSVDKLQLQKPKPTPKPVDVAVKKTVVHVLREDRQAERAALRSARATLRRINKKRSQLLTGLRALTAARNHVENQIHRHFVLKAVRARRLADGAARRAAWSHFLRRRQIRSRLLSKLKRWHNTHKDGSAAARRKALCAFLRKNIPARDRAALHAFLRHLRAKHAISSAKRAQYHANKAIAAAKSSHAAMDEAAALHPVVSQRKRLPLSPEAHDAEVARKVKEAVSNAILADRLKQAASRADAAAAEKAALRQKRHNGRRTRAAYHKRNSLRHRQAAEKAASAKALREKFLAQARGARFQRVLAEASAETSVEAGAGVEAELAAEAQAQAQMVAQAEAQQQAELAAQTNAELSVAAELEAATGNTAQLESEAVESLSAETEAEAEAEDDMQNLKDSAAIQAAAEETADLEHETEVHF